MWVDEVFGRIMVREEKEVKMKFGGYLFIFREYDIEEEILTEIRNK